MKIFKFALGQMQANCYLLIEGNDCLLIDPADEASFLLEEIMRRKLTLQALLATHGHFDHVMAVGEIQKSFNVPFYIHKKDLFLLKRIGSTAKHFLGFDPVVLVPSNIKNIKKGEQSIGSFTFEVIETPGHTPGSVCYFFEKEKLLFTGDTLFKEGIGRYDFAYSSKINLFTSLEQIFKLPGETEVYPGHGNDSFIEVEKSQSKSSNDKS